MFQCVGSFTKPQELFKHEQSHHDLFVFDSLRRLCESLDLEPLCCLEELGQLVLCNVDLPGIHELQDGAQVLQIYVLFLASYVYGQIWFVKTLPRRFCF